MQFNAKARAAACLAIMFLATAGLRAADVDEIEPNDDDSNALAFNVGDTLHGDFNSSPATDDFFSFATVAGNTYIFHATEQGCNTIINGAHPDIAIAILAPGGATQAISDVSGDCNGSFGGNEDISWTAPSDGVYFLDVFEATGSTSLSQSYTITTSETSPTPTPTPTPIPTPAPTPTMGEWSLILMALLMLVAGATLIQRRQLRV